MAKQHFYSRVPAKMSAFNRMDGYDTFAYSDGISQEFIEADLSAVYSNQPTKGDLVLMRDNALPTVYCQYITPDRVLVQSAVSFLASDFTGERSSYMVHSLVMEDREKQSVLCNPDSSMVNAALFQTDLSDFDLTNANAKPNTAFPEKELATVPFGELLQIAETYDTGILKRLIYALIGISCGKIKALYLGVSSDIATVSSETLQFLNAVYQILPYHIREALPFVTYVGDITKFSAFKVKGILETEPAVPTAKGVSIRLTTKDFTGINDVNIAANATVVDFLYSLLKKEDVRLAFLEFCRYAVEKNETYRKVTHKNLGDLVFLFRVLSGFYNESTVLPNDDAVYNFITTYEKNRDILTEEFRNRSMLCLKRYPQTHTPIPKNVFAHVTAMYRDEPEASRKTLLSVVQELIHTDVMRDKLFQFLKANYEAETPNVRLDIMEDICRVYYGGFLQDSILSFLAVQFPTEPAESRKRILERLFLTIRTPKVQKTVLEFLQRFYPTFSEAEKEQFYASFFEMLPEGDALTRALADLVDTYIEPERRDGVANAIVKAVEADEASAKPKIVSTLATRCGFCEEVIVAKALTEWRDKPIVQRIASATQSKPLEQRIASVREFWTVAPNMDEETSQALLNGLTSGFQESHWDVFELIRMCDELDTIAGDLSQASAFANTLKNKGLLPLINATALSVFDIKRHPNGVHTIAQLAQTRPYLAALPNYSCIAAYEAMIQDLQQNQGLDALLHAVSINDKAVRAGAAAQMNKDIQGMERQGQLFLYSEMILQFFKIGDITFSAASDSLRSRRLQEERLLCSKKRAVEAATRKCEDEVAFYVVNAAHALYQSSLDDEIKAKTFSETSDFGQTVSSYLSRTEGKGKKQLHTLLSAFSDDNDFANIVSATIKAPSSGGLFKKIFKK